MRSPKGRSAVTDFSTNFSSACAPRGISAAAAKRAISSAWRNIFSSSGYDDRRLLDDFAHEDAWIPVGRVGLCLAAAAGASHHQHLRSPPRRGKAEPPPAEAVLAFIVAELGLLPGVAAVAGEIDARHPRIAAEGDAACDRRRAGLQRGARLDVGDEGTRDHPADGDGF